MERKKASDFEPQPLSLFHRYVHGACIPKRIMVFHNDTTPRYDAEAAKLAWQRTIDHFNKTLKS